MSIFGLADEEMSWERFLQVTAGPHKESWREAITAAITSGQLPSADRLRREQDDIAKARRRDWKGCAAG
jgi:hypothetical protein